MTLAAGTKLGRYEVRSKIGQGGMGDVYLARDTKLERRVALKVLPADVASHRDRMDRFVREAKAAAALNHPNIAHVYEIDEVDGHHFIAMEFVEGHTLRELIRTAKAGREADALKTVAALEALALRRYSSPVRVACIYTGLGDKERAFEWLEKGYASRSDHLTQLKTDSMFDGLRADQRFADLLRRVGLH